MKSVNLFRLIESIKIQFIDKAQIEFYTNKF